MNVYQTIKRGRRIVIGTAGAVYLLAAVMLAVAGGSGGITPWQAVAIWVAVTLPATLALIALDRRPSLLPAAWMAAIVAGATVLESAPVWIVVAVIWARIASSRPRPPAERRWMSWGRPLLAAGLFVPVMLLMIHTDPVCTATYADGHVESLDPATRGFSEGWRFPLAWSQSNIGSESTSGPSSVSEECSSDTVVWWEAVVSVMASGLVVYLALRWPTAHDLALSITPGEIDDSVERIV
jgi:hypothetical protein